MADFFGIRRWDQTQLAEEARRWAAHGETQAVEFKEELPNQLRDLGKEIAAFATSNDGVILLGVTDSGEWVGLADLQTCQGRQALTGRIEGILANVVRPLVTPYVSFAELGGKVVAVVFVEKGSAPIYYASGVPYLRQLTASRPATPHEVMEFVLRRQDAVGATFGDDVDLGAWRGVDPLTLRQAACLWVGKDPAAHVAGELRGEEGAWLEILKQAARAGNLATTENAEPQLPPAGSRQDYVFASRKELKFLAERRGETPAFLLDGGEAGVQGAGFEPQTLEPGLWLEAVESDTVSNGTLEFNSVTLTIANKTGRDLQNVIVAITDMWRRDSTRIILIGTNRLNAPENLTAGECVQITMLTRERSKRGPWMLHLLNRPQPLAADEETTFKLALLADGEDLTRAILKFALRARSAQHKIAEQFVIPV